MGRYGDADAAYSWFLANGLSSNVKGLAAKISVMGKGTSTRGGLDVAWIMGEMFETVAGQPIDVGYFVTLQGSKIRKANSHDEFILGITSADSSFLADGGELRWENKLMGRVGQGAISKKNPWYPRLPIRRGRLSFRSAQKRNPSCIRIGTSRKNYLPRSKRPEWVAVGLLGKLRVRDDGTCRVDEYCMPNEDGIATAASSGYRVMERTGPIRFSSVSIDVGLELQPLPRGVCRAQCRASRRSYVLQRLISLRRNGRNLCSVRNRDVI